MSITSVVNDTLGRDSFVNSQKPLPPTITGYSISGLDDTALDPAGGQTVFINGNGFQRGATVTFDGSAVSVVTWVSANRLSFVAPAKSAGTYTIYVVNADGGTAIFIPGIIYSTLPTWTTAAGSLGSFFETTSISRTLVASGDAPITYSLLSGSLPPGATLSSGGVISGTSPVESGSTTYSFTVETIDAQLQSSTRSFSLTINTDVITWTNPSPGATINLDGSAYTTNLSALSAAGYSISGYSSNTLPQGLTLTGNTISGTPTTESTVSTVLSATAATTNRVGTNSITWVVSLGDTQFPSVTTLLSPQLSVQPFTRDASINNLPLTVFGDTRANGFSPLTPGYYSNFFDGAGDYLTLPSNQAQFTMGTGDFTIEMWVNVTSFATERTLYDTLSVGDATGTGRFAVRIPTNASVQLFTGSGQAIASGGTLVAGTWNHIAYSRQSNSGRLYVNGVQVNTTNTDNNNYVVGPTSRPVIGVNGFDNSTGPMLGFISNLRVVKGTAVYTANFTPPTTPLTAISGTSLLTCQSNTFVDASSNNFAITRVGDVRIDGFDPFVIPQEFAGRGSAFFDGTGDYITAPANGAFQLTGDFTLEAWIYPTVINSFNMVFGSENGANSDYLTIRASTLDLAIANASYPAWSHTFVANRWYHIAVTRSANTLRAFVNGVALTLSSGSATNSAQMFQSAGGLAIGRYGNTSTPHHFTGYISNARIVKGTALYTAAFTPPTQPLTAVANTSLLTCQTNQPHNNNQFLDSSTSNFLLSRFGNPTQGAFSPYGGGWSNYFDGNGDLLTIASNAAFGYGTGAFTIECWFNTQSVSPSGAAFLFDQRTTNNQAALSAYINPSAGLDLYVNGAVVITGGTLAVNTWNHFALARSGTTTRMFLNGVQVGSSFTDNNNYGNLPVVIGSRFSSENFFTGHISNFRIVRGTALYTANFTPPNQPLQPIAGTSLLTCADNRLIDDSPNNFAITRAGDVRVEKFNPFGLQTSMVPQTHSVFFDGTGDFLDLPNNTVFSQTGSWTLELWVYPTAAVNNYVYSQNTANFLQINITGTNFVAIDRSGVGNIITSTSAIPLNAWTHIALVSDSTNMRLFINGTQSGSTAPVGTQAASATTTRIGAYQGTGTLAYQGYVSNLRLVKGTAVYTANFTPPTQPLTAISGTGLLTCQSSTLVDNSTNSFAITASGEARPTQTNPFGFTPGTRTGYTPQVFGGSMTFDGTGDYLQSPSQFTITTGPFTIEAWVYLGSVGTIKMIVDNAVWQTGQNAGYRLSINTSNFILLEASTGTFNTFPAVITATSSALTTGQWNHVSCTRDSSNLVRLFVNGVSVATPVTYTNSLNLSTTTGFTGKVGVSISDGGTFNFMNGHLSDVRVIPGTALYTSNFVPPMAPLQPIVGTTVLLNGTGAAVYDASTQNNLETVGDVKIDQFAPYNAGYYSNFFDGTGDFLTVPSNSAQFGTGDFTIEFWVNLNSLAAATGIVDFRATSGATFGQIYIATDRTVHFYLPTDVATTNTITLNTWNHVAITRSSGTLRMFIDGVLGLSVSAPASYNASGAVTIGGGVGGTGLMTGHLSNLRFVVGTAVYTANFTPPTQPLTAITNTSLLTCRSNRFIDTSTNNSAITRNGDVRVQTQNPFQNNSGQSYYFDGTGDHLVTYSPAVNQSIGFGTGNFTVEFWFNATSNAGTQQLFDTRPTGQGSTSQYIALTYLSGSLNYYTATANPAISGGAVGPGVWNHVALCRSGTSTRLFVNGVQVGATFTDNQNYLGAINRPIIGTDGNSPNVSNLTGYISDLRITRGVARYTANFTPPATALQTR